MRQRAAEFGRLAESARDPVVQGELVRLVILYEGQADRLERGEDLPTDPGECE